MTTPKNITLLYVPSTMPRRYCTAESPMQQADKDRFQWGHPDAEFVAPLVNLAVYTCPHCKLTFHAPKRKAGQ